MGLTVKIRRFIRRDAESGETNVTTPTGSRRVAVYLDASYQGKPSTLYWYLLNVIS